MSERTVLITGGTRGIGAAVARAFHAAGDFVVVASRTDSGLAVELDSKACYIKADARSVADLRRMVSEAFAWRGRLDVLVNNAGMSAWRPLAEADEAFWDDMLATNLKSAFFATQAAAPHLPRGGVVVNVSSLAGKRGSANNSVYCAAKFGVNGMTQALAKELGSKGIRVNAVCPVYVRTEGVEDALRDPRSPAGGRPIDAYLADFASSQTALGVLPTGEQVGAACVFLASLAAGAITGQCLNVDCGVMPS